MFSTIVYYAVEINANHELNEKIVKEAPYIVVVINMFWIVEATPCGCPVFLKTHGLGKAQGPTSIVRFSEWMKMTEGCRIAAG